MSLRIAALFVALLNVVGCAGLGDHMGGSGESSRITASTKAGSPFLLAASVSRDAGRYEEALQIYQQVLIADPKNLTAQLGVAECLLALGRYADSRVIFEALANDPDQFAVAQQGVGISYLATNQRELAEKALREAVAADPGLWRSWNALGMIADLRHQPKVAIDFYNRALAIKPDSALLLNNLGYSELLSGNPAQAAGHLRRALALDPASDTIRNNLRLAIAAQGRYSEATLSTPPAHLPEVLNNVGYMAMQRGDYSAAEGFFGRAMVSSTSFNSVTARNLDELKALKDGAR